MPHTVDDPKRNKGFWERKKRTKTFHCIAENFFKNLKRWKFATFFCRAKYFRPGKTRLNSLARKNCKSYFFNRKSRWRRRVSEHRNKKLMRFYEKGFLICLRTRRRQQQWQQWQQWQRCQWSWGTPVAPLKVVLGPALKIYSLWRRKTRFRRLDENLRMELFSSPAIRAHCVC